jgi:hypothetical protein
MVQSSQQTETCTLSLPSGLSTVLKNLNGGTGNHKKAPCACSSLHDWSLRNVASRVINIRYRAHAARIRIDQNMALSVKSVSMAVCDPV